MSLSTHTSDGYRVSVRFDFGSEKAAEIARRTLSVDAPPPRSSVAQQLRRDTAELVCDFNAQLSGDRMRDPKQQLAKLRIAVHAFVDLATLVQETLSTFGADAAVHL